ncbi:diguanylate cyclase domain-containing protein [Paracoccus sanguinis]|uniref:diguanylate cyclase domain-containing protein n=1 Tax=Paracoccus sanguinis TaxID=1545044 RepID=UPI001451E715|nr:diguanylate cyclase [Paracoccus sanguinis]QJD15716.1 diguanylate cyclase [Paracoccus sanguinis]
MSGQILVVDGTATHRITLKVRLAAACYDPLTARTGVEALAILARARPTLVLIGGEPGDMGAVDLCGRIAAGWPGVPVLMIVPQADRIAALKAGAAAVLDGPVDDLNLFARIRGLMRDEADAAPRPLLAGLAEDQATFAFEPALPALPPPSVLLVAGDTATALGWRRTLAPRLAARLSVADADRALADAAVGLVPDLYVIAADLSLPGDGLRLLSELRCRRTSRNASFAVVLPSHRQEMMSVALDLGAGDVLAAGFAAEAVADEAALRLSGLIRRKRSADKNRAAAEHERTLARIDPLTGLVNRRFALPRLAGMCDAPARDGRGCAVVAIDIDRFKQVNDHHGHAAGDAVLIEVAERIERVVPPSGFVARMGGEEFLAALPDTSPAEAAALAEAMRQAVSARPVSAGGAGVTLSITISAGVSTLTPDLCGAGRDRAAALLLRADGALMSAKRAGRNRLMVAGLDAVA